MKTKLACILGLILSAFSSAHAQTEARFAQYINAWQTPNAIWDNRHALDIRLQLLDVAPSGTNVDIATFLWDNGDATRVLAAHVCRAARRGVNIRILVDSKSGSIPGAANLFNKPISEEVFQYMANCGAHIRVFNHLPKFLEVAGHVVPAIEYLVNLSLSAEDRAQGIIDPQVAMNRLNHRKIYYIETPLGRKCVILGGRNLGDSYLTWKPDSFVDGDIVLCDHHLTQFLSTPLGVQLNQAIAQTKAAYEDTWFGKDISAGVPLEWYDVQPNLEFNFKSLTLAAQTVYGGVIAPRDQAEFALVQSTATATVEGTIPAARPPPTGNAVQGVGLLGTRNFRVMTSGWHRPVDYIRDHAHDVIAREQVELYIESAYMEFDPDAEALLLQALDRGVKVTILTNSMYTTDGGSKLISLVRSDWTAQALAKYGLHNTPDFTSYYNNSSPTPSPASALGELHFFVTTAAAGHMIHFKGYGGKCQKGADGSYYATYTQTSHNLHLRSGLTDKEIGLNFERDVDLDCINKIGREKFTPAQIAAAEARYEHQLVNGILVPTRLRPENLDWIESRKRFWSGLNLVYKAKGKPILKYFASLDEELKQATPGRDGHLPADIMLKLGYGFVENHIMRPVDPNASVRLAGPGAECTYILQKAEEHFGQGVFKILSHVVSPFL